jgi:hypothetical protein
MKQRNFVAKNAFINKSSVHRDKKKNKTRQEMKRQINKELTH